MRRARLLLVATGLAEALLAGCGEASTSAGGSATSAVASSGSSAAVSGSASTAPSASAPAALSGSLTVLAAASLTEAFNDGEKTLEAAHPGYSATLSFAGSQMLVQQIQQGAPADVIATADTATMQKLVAAGLVGTPRTFAGNVLEIVVAANNPKRVAGLADLARSDLVVILADTSVPAGNYGRQVLDRAGVHVTPKSLELNVKAEVQKVASGEADAAIVYATDVRAGGARVSGVAIADAQNIVATYPIAVVTASTHPAAAAAFVESCVSGEVQTALRARGFRPPPAV